MTHLDFLKKYIKARGVQEDEPRYQPLLDSVSKFLEDRGIDRLTIKLEDRYHALFAVMLDRNVPLLILKLKYPRLKDWLIKACMDLSGRSSFADGEASDGRRPADQADAAARFFSGLQEKFTSHVAKLKRLHIDLTDNELPAVYYMLFYPFEEEVNFLERSDDAEAADPYGKKINWPIVIREYMPFLTMLYYHRLVMSKTAEERKPYLEFLCNVHLRYESPIAEVSEFAAQCLPILDRVRLLGRLDSLGEKTDNDTARSKNIKSCFKHLKMWLVEYSGSLNSDPRGSSAEASAVQVKRDAGPFVARVHDFVCIIRAIGETKELLMESNRTFNSLYQRLFFIALIELYPQSKNENYLVDYKQRQDAGIEVLEKTHNWQKKVFNESHPNLGRDRLYANPELLQLYLNSRKVVTALERAKNVKSTSPVFVKQL